MKHLLIVYVILSNLTQNSSKIIAKEGEESLVKKLFAKSL